LQDDQGQAFATNRLSYCIDATKKRTVWIMPLSVYAPFRFVKYLRLPNSFLSLSFYAPFCLPAFPFWQILNSAKFLFASFCLCPFPVRQILDYACFLYASFLYASFLYALFRFCPFPFMPLFRIDGNGRLCRIPLCQLPASRELAQPPGDRRGVLVLDGVGWSKK
jgi:hypothetical protein